jgi:hypothetical protein
MDYANASTIKNTDKPQQPLFKELGDLFTSEIESQQKLITSIENKLHELHNTREAKEESDKMKEPQIGDAGKFFASKITELHYFNNRLDMILQKLNSIF